MFNARVSASLMVWTVSWVMPTHVLAAALPSPPAHVPSETTSPQTLAASAPAVDPDVLSLALAATRCAQAQGVGTAASRLAVIDYSRPSLDRRMWLFDLNTQAVLAEEWVAHGQGSGENLPHQFSNDEGSHASSLGLFLTGDTYQGRNGYSMRMQGLEKGVNDNAMARAIVVHGAAYVNPANAQRQGRLGRSWGCPALRSEVARPLIDLMKNGQFIFSYYPDQAWLMRSALLKCPASGLTQAPRPGDESRPAP